MPVELQIIRASEFVRLGAHGHFDLAASKAALATLAGACRKRGIDRALVDLRALRPGPKPVFSRADLIELVNTFREMGFTHRERLAIPYHSDPHHRARLFAFLSTLHGWSVKAFGDFEAAVFWLSNGREMTEEPGGVEMGKRIRVQHSKAETHPAVQAVTIGEHRRRQPGAVKKLIPPTRGVPRARAGRSTQAKAIQFQILQ